MTASEPLSPGNRHPNGAPHPLDFFSHLVWIDGRPLLDTIEPYRRGIFRASCGRSMRTAIRKSTWR